MEWPGEEEADEDGDWGQAWDVGTVSDHVTANTRVGQHQGPRTGLKHPTPDGHGLTKYTKATGMTAPTVTTVTTGVTQPSVITGAAPSRLLLNDNKAGMEGLDRDKINQVIFEASKGSKYYENELKKEEQVNKRIQEQADKLARLSPEMILQGCGVADTLLAELESHRDLSRTIVHVDMDMFYAAVEMQDQPSLRDKPMAVGSNAMLSTSNYHARRFGVRAAMPGFIGRKLCPDLVIVSSDFDKYRAVSKVVRGILEQYDPNMCPMSLDEAYLDLTDHLVQRQAYGTQERTYSRARGPGEMCGCAKTRDTACGSDSKQPEVTMNKTAQPEVTINDTVVAAYSTKVTTNSETQLAKIQHSTCKDSTQTEPILCDDQRDSKGSPNMLTSDDQLCSSCGRPMEGSCEVVTFGLGIEDAVREMRFRIQQQTSLTASAGIAPNLMLAKVCSDKNKPNGQYLIPSTKAAVMDFITELPIRKISGIGKVSEKLLRALGVTVCRDLYTHRGALHHLYSNISFNYFMRICRGIGATTVERDGERKSMSTERTFSELCVPAELYQKCSELCEALSDDLLQEQMLGKTVTLKIKLSSFEQRTRSHTVGTYCRDTATIYSTARDLLRHEISTAGPGGLRLRLMGVRMSNLLHQRHVSDHKQETIKGLFRKIQTKAAGSPSTSPVKDEARYCPSTSPDNGQPRAGTSQNTSLSTSRDSLGMISKQHSEGLENLSALEDGEATQNSADHPNLSLTSTVRAPPNPLFISTVKAPDKSCSSMTPDEMQQIYNLGEEKVDMNSNINSKACQFENTKDFMHSNSSDSTEQISTFGFVCHTKEDYMGIKDAQVYVDHYRLKEERSSRQVIEENSIELVQSEPLEQSCLDSVDQKSVQVKSEKPEQWSISCADVVNTEANVETLEPKKDTLQDSIIPDQEQFQDTKTKNLVMMKQATVQEKTVQKINCDVNIPKQEDLECPVCYKTRSYRDMASFTAHVDECLARRCVDDDVPSTTKPAQEDEIFVCPICNAPQRRSSLVLFNQHVDACLNRQTIRELVQEAPRNGKRISPDTQASGSTPKRQKLDKESSKGKIHSFFSPKGVASKNK